MWKMVGKREGMGKGRDKVRKWENTEGRDIVGKRKRWGGGRLVGSYDL